MSCPAPASATYIRLESICPRPVSTSARPVPTRGTSQAPASAPREGRDHAEDGGDRRHVLAREAEGAIEGRRHHPGQRLAQLEQPDEEQDGQPVRPPHESAKEGIDVTESAAAVRRPAAQSAARERDDAAPAPSKGALGEAGHREQRGRGGGIGPGPADPPDQEQRARAAGEQRQPVAPDIGGEAPGLFALGIGEHLDAVGVEHDVLAGGQEGDQRRQGDGERRAVHRVRQPDGADRGDQQQLGWLRASPAAARAVRSGGGGGRASSAGDQRNLFA